ncbi:MAG: glycerol-3-phosphate dehydrogenase/oxidase [Candidatus Calescibacterium sp.]|nr:glycerol-3-phosphate dehydrogenase/oxidase [Candidatus Calescibacterium sp.]
MGEILYDVAIIGGGINGVGIARDLSLRGIKCILFEKNDFGWATTWSSSSMVHGGARYIINDIGVTEKSSKEAGVLTEILPYMLSRRPFLLLQNSKTMLNLFDIYMDVYDFFSKKRYSIKHIRLSPDEVLQITGGEVLVKTGGILIEEYAVDPQRMALVNAISASENGAQIYNHTEVISARKSGDLIEVIAQNKLNNSEIKIKSKLLVNSSGPWIDKVVRNVFSSKDFPDKKRNRLRPTKGIHIVFPGKVLNTVLSFLAIDGRYLLFVPLEDRTILGTTDDDFFGDPDDVDILRDEVEYLLHSAERFIPKIRDLKPFSTKVGLRPTPYVYGKNEDKITREFEIEDIDGFINVSGGKLASFRLLSEIVSDYVCKKLGVNKKSRTAYVQLPGADSAKKDERGRNFERFTSRLVDEISTEYLVPDNIAYFLVKKYGDRSKELIKKYGFGDLVCRCANVFEGEIKWAVKEEMAFTLDDIARRTWACDNLCNGIMCLKKIEKVITEIGGIPKTNEFILRRKKLLYPVRMYNPKLWEEFENFAKKELKE